jgi:tetratricopeptide (TPR) repeat protein
MNRSLVTLLMIGLAAIPATSQQTAPQTSPQIPQSHAVFPDKQELLRQIALYEAAAKNAQATHDRKDHLIKIYLHLGGMYEDAALYLKSEDALRNAIALLRDEPKNELADAIAHLSVLHVAMGELRDAEKEQLEVLRISESIGDPIGIAESWNDLADLYIKERHFKKALEYAQKAIAVIGDAPKVDPSDRIAIRRTLGIALCETGDCAHAIPLLKDAIDLAKTSYGEDSLQVGIGYYLMGQASWHCGDMVDAAEWMERGTKRMKVDLGWGHVIYVNAMTQYARFLRERGQMEAAASAQREIRQSQNTVDVRSFTGR